MDTELPSLIPRHYATSLGRMQGQAGAAARVTREKLCLRPGLPSKGPTSPDGVVAGQNLEQAAIRRPSPPQAFSVGFKVARRGWGTHDGEGGRRFSAVEWHAQITMVPSTYLPTSSTPYLKK